jgi:hypothetical protein
VTAIETDRLAIRNFGPDDWQDLQEVAVQYRASKWAKYEDPWPTSTEEVKGMVEWFAQGDGYLAVSLKATGKLIGLIAIERRKDQEERVHNLAQEIGLEGNRSRRICHHERGMVGAWSGVHAQFGIGRWLDPCDTEGIASWNLIESCVSNGRPNYVR